MANYANLKATINANIKANGNEEITGPILNTVLNQAVTTLGAGYQYMGVATPATSPGTPDANVFYIAATPGTYTNFGGKVVADGEVAILKYNGSWTKEVSGAATAAQVTQLGQDVEDLETHIEGRPDYNVDFSALPQYDYMIQRTQKYWMNYLGSKSVLVPVTPSARFRFMGGARASYYGFLKSNTNISERANADLSDIDNTIHDLPYNVPTEGTIPADANYIYVLVYYNGSSLQPASLTIYGETGVDDRLDALDDEVEQINDAIVEINGDASKILTIVGGINPTNGVLTKTLTAYLTSEYLPIDRTRPIKVTHVNGTGGVGLLTYYDGAKKYISSIPGVSSITDLDIAISSIPTNARYIRVTALASDITAETTIEINSINGISVLIRNLLSPYDGKKCLYIGDSISTGNNYYWKGYVEKTIGMSYVVDNSDPDGLWAAAGGIALMAQENDATVLNKYKSIWYRCANNRMAAFAPFDVVSIFGGTNDLANSPVVGSPSDKPYVDDASSFDVPANYTDVFSNDLTFCQNLRGCIEMIHRDFPNATILIPTIMPCSNLGNETDPMSGLPLSEAIAVAQIAIANKYSFCIPVPFYWGARKADTTAAFSQDGVHPNTVQARIMTATVKSMLEIVTS